MSDEQTPWRLVGSDPPPDGLECLVIDDAGAPSVSTLEGGVWHPPFPYHQPALWMPVPGVPWGLIGGQTKAEVDR